MELLCACWGTVSLGGDSQARRQAGMMLVDIERLLKNVTVCSFAAGHCLTDKRRAPSAVDTIELNEEHESRIRWLFVGFPLPTERFKHSLL